MDRKGNSFITKTATKNVSNRGFELTYFNFSRYISVFTEDLVVLSRSLQQM
jgi:hypothetical protein